MLAKHLQSQLTVIIETQVITNLGMFSNNSSKNF